MTHTQSTLEFPARNYASVQLGRRTATIGLAVIGCALLGAAGWIVSAPISGAVIAPGTVKVDTSRKTVQHQEGGIVKQILVRDGDHVQAGDTLAVLDDVRVNATYESTRTQLDSELARTARLSAERELSDRITFGDELMRRSNDARVAEFLQRESTLFRVRRDALLSQIALLRAQVGQAQAEIVAREEQDRAETRSVTLQQEELEANHALLAQGYVAKTRLLGLQRQLADYQARRSDNQAETFRAEQKISELELRVVAARNTYMQQAADELKESSARVFDLQERLRSAQDAAQRQLIVAPVAGVVVDLKPTGAGFALGPRQPLLDIVPEDADLLIEARIRPEDINYVHVGAETDVRLTPFKRRITPIVTGSVVYVSADSIADDAHGISYYVARVRVDSEALKSLGDVRLRPGMPAEVFVKTGERTVFEYVADPVLAFVMRSFREPR